MLLVFKISLKVTVSFFLKSGKYLKVISTYSNAIGKNNISHIPFFIDFTPLITAHTSDSWCYKITLQTGLRHRWCPLTAYRHSRALPCSPALVLMDLQHGKAQGPVNSLFWGVGLRLADLETIFLCVGARVGWRRQGLVHAPFFPITLQTSDIFISWFLPHSNDSHTLLRTQTPHCPPRTPLSWWRSKLMELNSRCKDYSVSVEVQGELMFVMNLGSIKGWRYHYRMLGFVKNLSINNSEVSSLSSMPGRLQLNSFSRTPFCAAFSANLLVPCFHL